MTQGFDQPFTETCLDAVAALRSVGHDLTESYLLGAYPSVSGNPYQRMLYCAGIEEGFACLKLTSPQLLDLAPQGLGLIAHYHWLNRIFYGLSSTSDAKSAANGLLDHIKRQRDNGVKLLWTLHNKLSHHAAFPDEEIYLRSEFAELVDLVHIMNPKSPDICAPLYELPAEKLFHIPHPSYLGVYSAFESAQSARLALKVEPDRKVILLFGSLGPHKGTRQFLAKMDELQRALGGKAQLVIAGKRGEPGFMEDIYRLVAGRADVSLHLGHVKEQNVQLFFKAADAVVCPYPDGLNSGVINTALSYGRPVVAPQSLAASITGLKEGMYPYVGDMEACIEACARAAAGEEDHAPAFAEWAQKHESRAISKAFFTALKGRL